MFKYSVTAYIGDKTGYYLRSDEITRITVTVYARTAKEAEDKALTVVPDIYSFGSNFKWVINIDKIEEVISN